MRFPSVSLRAALLVSLLAFCLVPAGLVGGLLYRSNVHSVDQLADAVIRGVSERVLQDAENHLSEVHTIFNGLMPAEPSEAQTQTARRFITQPDSFEQIAFTLTRMSQNVPYLYFGTNQGEFLGVENLARVANNRTQIKRRLLGEELRRVYIAAQPGDRSQLVETETKPFDPRKRPWYDRALRTRSRVFTDVYVSAVNRQLVITLSQPIFGASGDVMGVFAADLYLKQINEMLQAQTISERGAAYLVDDQGFLVASSAGDSLSEIEGDQIRRVRPDSSANASVRASYALVGPLLNKYREGSTQRVSVNERLAQAGGENLLVVKKPFGEHLGLRWSLVVAAPERDFTSEVEKGVRQSVLTMAALVALAALLAGWLAYVVSRMFARLTGAADQLGRGETPAPMGNAPLNEVRRLSLAMHRSGQSLTEARAEIESKAQALAQANEHLEARVEKRTEQLTASREEALQAAKAKAAFLATMSHEIRTPLNGVVGMTTLMADTPLNDEQQDYLHTMRVSSDQLLGVINDILDFSKIESGKLELENEPLNLLGAVEEACDIAAPRAREKGLELVVDMADGVPHWVRGDVTRLRQVLLNFINNAIKFTERGEIIVSARVLEEFSPGSSPADGALLEFRVKDKGIGIPPDRMGALFESFTQVDTSTTRKYGGTGLGLAICKRLAHIMGGDVGVDSALGEGSTFWFTARLGYADTPAHSDSSLAQLTSLEGRRALVVDDTEVNLRILLKQLQRWNMDVTVFARPQDALDWLQTHTVDVIVTDMHMPEMDGLGFARAMQTACAQRGQTAPRLLLLTSGMLPTGDDASLFDVRMFKPYRQTQLFEAIARILLTRSATTTAKPSVRRRLHQTVLVADDNVVNLKVAMAMLGKLGFDGVTVANGSEAVDAVSASLEAGATPFAAVLMDVNMPVMDGFDASRTIIARHPHIAPPIIALTASVLEEDRKRCLDAGMVGFLAKPLRIDELTQSLGLWVTEKTQPAGALQANHAAINNIAVHADNTPANSQFDAKKLELRMDWSRLEQFKEFDDETLSMTREVVQLFVADVPARLADLHSALAAADAGALARASHALKGAAGNVGALSISDRCAVLEQLAKENTVPPDAAEQIAAIAAAADASVAALQAWK